MGGNSVLIPCKRARALFIPDHICDLILCKLVPFSRDYFLFGCVCKQWFSVLMADRLRRRRLHNSNQLVPLMVLPTRRDHTATRKVVVNSLFSVTHNSNLDGVNLRVTCDVADDDIINYCGSSFGWLCYFRSSFQIVLYDPFSAHNNNSCSSSSSSICLPPIMRSPPNMPCSTAYNKRDDKYWNLVYCIPRNLGFQYAVRKVVLSADPRTAPDFVVATIYCGWDRLAFFSYNANANANANTFPCWTSYEEDNKRGSFLDVIFHQGLVYACDRRLVHVIKVDIEDSVAVYNVVAKIDNPITIDLPFYVSYLTATTKTNELLMIIKLLWHRPPDQIISIGGFRVFKLIKHHGEELRWVKMRSLDGDAVFVGFNHTVSVVPSASSRCLPDSIYFTDDYPNINEKVGPYGSQGPCNMGAYDFNNPKRVKPYIRIPTLEPMPPIWILPMF